MFRPNRVGTPYIFSETSNVVTADYTPVESDPTGNSAYTGNAINATPLLDFGQTSLYIARAETYAAARRSGFIHQFTISQPLAGDVAGLELIGHITTLIPGDACITPFFGKRNGTAALLGSVSFGNGSAIQIGPSSPAIPGNTTAAVRSLSFQAQVIVRDTTLAFGDFGAGFFINTGATPWSFTWAHISASIRQLNDQENIGYRDTLR